MSRVTTKMASMWQKLAKKNYRQAFNSAKIDSDLAAQIYALRNQRGWTQSDLAVESAMAQPRIAKLEASCDGVSTATLKRLADAFDVALQIRFVPFSQMVSESAQGSIDKQIPSFAADASPVARGNFGFQLISNTNRIISIRAEPTYRPSYQSEWDSTSAAYLPHSKTEVQYA